MQQIPDSLIFDMDGTLWDAVDSFVMAWNEGARLESMDRVFTRDELVYVMGWERGKVLAHMLPDHTPEERELIYATINKCREKIIPQFGGVLYKGVQQGLAELSKKYKLFIVSNCPKGMIVQFMEFADVMQYITDEMAHGVNFMPKSHNIGLLKDKYNLRNPVYIGDTHGDSIESGDAAVPFVFVSYGFGVTHDFELQFDNFESLTSYFMGL